MAVVRGVLRRLRRRHGHRPARRCRSSGPSIGSGSDFSTLTILVPNIRLNGDSPKVGGLDVATQTVTFSGLDDGTNNVIQATYWTVDSA